MANVRCMAQLALDKPGEFAICDRFVEGHIGSDHKDYTRQAEWPACSKHCLKSHVHGRYRLKLGAPTGPGTAAARAMAGRKGESRAPRPKQCSVCLATDQPLDGGKCKDQAACAERAPQLDLEI